MDFIVEWSPEALEDIEEIYNYINKDSPFYAQTVVEKIITASRHRSRLLENHLFLRVE